MPITSNLSRYSAKDQMQPPTVTPKNSIASTSASPIASANRNDLNVRKAQHCARISHDFCKLIENEEAIIIPRVKKHMSALMREVCPDVKSPGELAKKLNTFCNEQS